MKDGKLEVGDVLYTERFGTINKHKIERLTKTTAVSKEGKRFRINVNGEYVDIIGAGTWDCHFARIEDKQTKDRYDTAALRYKIEKAIPKLELDKLKRINDILDEE